MAPAHVAADEDDAAAAATAAVYPTISVGVCVCMYGVHRPCSMRLCVGLLSAIGAKFLISLQMREKYLKKY